MTRVLTHERCAHRCCCDSWSCGSHLATCSTVERRRREEHAVAAVRSLAAQRDFELQIAKSQAMLGDA